MARWGVAQRGVAWRCGSVPMRHQTLTMNSDLSVLGSQGTYVDHDSYISASSAQRTHLAPRKQCNSALPSERTRHNRKLRKNQFEKKLTTERNLGSKSTTPEKSQQFGARINASYKLQRHTIIPKLTSKSALEINFPSFVNLREFSSQ